MGIVQGGDLTNGAPVLVHAQKVGGDPQIKCKNTAF